MRFCFFVLYIIWSAEDSECYWERAVGFWNEEPVHAVARPLDLVAANDGNKVVLPAECVHSAPSKDKAAAACGVLLEGNAKPLVAVGVREADGQALVSRVGPEDVAEGSVGGRLSEAVDGVEFCDRVYRRAEAAV